MGRSKSQQTDLPYRRIGNHALLAVRLTPKAKEDVILGIEQFGSERVLKARVRAVPEQGCGMCGMRVPRALIRTVQARTVRCSEAAPPGDRPRGSQDPRNNALRAAVRQTKTYAACASVKSARLASRVTALSVQSTRTLQPFLVVCGPCTWPALL